MAMLAEPRRKQKVINLRAKNNAWSNDTNKFGQRMLEKMGWSSGKGLGAKENGIVEHVVARYKNDDKGLGFEDRNDQWTKHEDDFNALLANLSNGDDTEPQTHSGVSLEVKSKKSKARVHFHKFTRAKDLSRYSEKDLANIFGKKALKSEEKQEDILKEDVKTTEQVFTEKGSMEDYFKNKLQALSSKNVSLPINEKCEDGVDFSFRGFAGTTSDNIESENTGLGFGFSFYPTNVQNSKTNESKAENEGITNAVEYVKKSKKKKKSRKNGDTDEVEGTIDSKEMASFSSKTDNCKPYEKVEESTKKKKKSKQEKYQENELENLENNVGEPPKKKKSKKKKDLNFEQGDSQEDNCLDEPTYVPKKKKKKEK